MIFGKQRANALSCYRGIGHIYRKFWKMKIWKKGHKKNALGNSEKLGGNENVKC